MILLREKVVAFLEALGVTGAADDPLVDFVISNVEYKVLNETNTDLPMPDGVGNVAVDMAVGEYLKVKKASGQLDGFDLEVAVKQLQEGDTNIQYAIGAGSTTPEQRLDTLIETLIGRKQELYRFRRLVW